MQKFSLQPGTSGTKERQDQGKGSYNAQNPINPVAIVAAKYGLNPLAIKRQALDGMPPAGVPENKLISPSFETTTRPSEKFTSPCLKTPLGAGEGRFASPSFSSRPTISTLNPCSLSVTITASEPDSRFVSQSHQQFRQSSSTHDVRFDPSPPSFPLTARTAENRLMFPSFESTSTARTPDSRLNSPSPSFQATTGALGNRFSLRTFENRPRFTSPSFQDTTRATENKFSSLSIQTAKAQESRVAFPFSPTNARAYAPPGTSESKFAVRAPRTTFSSANSQKAEVTHENRFISPSVQDSVRTQENKCTSVPFQSTSGASENKITSPAVLKNQNQFSWVSAHVKDGTRGAEKAILADSSNTPASKMRSSKVAEELRPNRMSPSQVTGSVNESRKVNFYCGGTENSTFERGSTEDIANTSPISPRFTSDLTATMLSGKCMCERCPKVVLCRACGSLMKGRMRKQCPQHPKQIFLMDMTCCCQCQSSNLTEICDSGK